MSFHTVQYEGIAIEYELLRKDVKYINLRVNKRGEVVVSAGKRVPFAVIEEFVQSKTVWIIQHLAEIEKRRQSLPDETLFDGKTLFYLGKPYPLRLSQTAPCVRLEQGEIRLSLLKWDAAAARELYLAWLRTQATETFEAVMDRVLPLVQDLSIERPEIKIRNMRTIWGSCTVREKRIRLNLQLIKTAEDCIEQVALHELLHFRYPNHDAAFYAEMDRRMPDWRERKHRLETRYKDGI